MPSASAPNAWHRPVGDRPNWLLKSANSTGVAATNTPPTMASEHSSDRSAWLARCMATRAEEQAVSTVTAGPSRPSVYATRPEITLVRFPVIR
jgi:hypothetical protein